MKKWLSRIIKISFFLFAFMAVILTVLFNMGGSSDTLKGAIEDYIAQSTGYAAQIGTFNKMTFFPNISVDLENIKLVKPDIEAMQKWAEQEATKPEEERGLTAPPFGFETADGTIERLILSVGFWDVGLGQGRKIRDIRIENARFNAGTIHHKPLTIKRLGIDETAEGKPYLTGIGDLGGDDWTGNMALQSIGKHSKPKYKIGDESAFDFKIGTLDLNGVMRPRTMGGLHLRDLKIRHKNTPVMDATLTFARDDHENIDMKGDFLIPQFGSNATFDGLIMRQPNHEINLTIQAQSIDTRDFNAASNLSAAWSEWNRIFKNPNDLDPQARQNITVKTNIFKDGGAQISDHQTQAYIQENSINFKAAQ